MQNKIKNIPFKIKPLLKNKFFWLILIALIVSLFIFSKKEDTSISIITPTQGNLKNTLNATGVLTSVTELNLSFKKSGTVKSLLVDVGSKVRQGQILASLSSGGELAELTRARASLLSAEARLQKTIEGSTNEEVNLAKVSLENAKKDLENVKNIQNNLVNNAYKNLLNSSVEAISENTNDTRTPPTISGNYNLGKEGDILINIYNSNQGLLFSLSGLVSGGGTVSSTNPQALGNSGLFILFSDTSNIAGSSWVISLPNQKASNYLTNQNNYTQALNTKASAISSAESLVAQREAELALKQSKARNSDIALGEADVLSAKGNLAFAQSNYEDTLIRAPKSGTITKIDIKIGEVANANNTAIVVKDVSNLYVEALINESNISDVKLDQNVSIIFDALPGQDFTGKVSHIDPSSLNSDGVVNYKIKVFLNENNTNIRPGMNAEIIILVEEKNDVLSIPKAALISKENQYFVNKITNEKNKKYQEVPVEIGMSGDGNLVEIISGISQNDLIALIDK